MRRPRVYNKLKLELKSRHSRGFYEQFLFFINPRSKRLWYLDQLLDRLRHDRVCTSAVLTASSGFETVDANIVPCFGTVFFTASQVGSTTVSLFFWVLLLLGFITTSREEAKCLWTPYTHLFFRGLISYCWYNPQPMRNDHSIAGTTILQTTLEDADNTQCYWW